MRIALLGTVTYFQTSHLACDKTDQAENQGDQLGSAHLGITLLRESLNDYRYMCCGILDVYLCVTSKLISEFGNAKHL